MGYNSSIAWVWIRYNKEIGPDVEVVVEIIMLHGLCGECGYKQVTS